jgi:acetyl-CoA carboxylase carboxyl transferase subunit alpha
VATLDFERPIAELDAQIARLREVLQRGGTDDDASAEVARLEETARALRAEIFRDLGAWEKVQLSRHPDRPYTLDYLPRLLTDFVELHGDRLHGDDASIVGGLARFAGRPVVVIGHQKGRGVKEAVRRNFGMPHPEGYRKARRLVELAGRFGRPIVTLIDTSGAYPGIGAEARGQSEAIGQSLLAFSRAPVPVIAVVIGEGGSGGALALGVANRVLMLEHAVYSVITPEGCASILWKDSSRAPEAAMRLKLTATELYRLGVIDEVVLEPLGGAHRDPPKAAELAREAVARHLDELSALSPEALVEDRYRRFRALGEFIEETDGVSPG